MRTQTKTIQTILLLGALWGMCEASIGYVLHFLPAGFSGTLMVPIGFYFTYSAYKLSGKRSAALWVGMIAASVKLIDLLLPAHSPLSVINPAMAIMLESLLVFVFAKRFSRERVFVPALVLGLSWIVLFTLVQALIVKPASGLYLQPPFQVAALIVLNALAAGLLITLYLKRQDSPQWKIEMRKPSYALPAMCLALALAMELANSLVI